MGGFVSGGTFGSMTHKIRSWDVTPEWKAMLKNSGEWGQQQLAQIEKGEARAKTLGPRIGKAHAAAKAAATGAAVRSGAMTAAKVLGPIGVVAASEKAAGATPSQEAAMMQASMRDPNSFYNTRGPGSVKRPAYAGQSVVSSLMGVKNPKR